MHEGFVYLDEAIPGARWDEKYATGDNFTGAIVDGYLVNRVVVAQEMAEALRRAEVLASARGLGLFFFDGYRPQRAVDCFLRWANAPEDGKTKARHYPNIEKAQIVAQGYVAARSGHTRGGAIDLTLFCREDGAMLDMGGGFDLMDRLSHHGAAGVSRAAARNRALLRAIMETCGLRAYASEWWHYSLAREPYPNTYFDFPID